MAELDDASFVAFYVYRANGSYEMYETDSIPKNVHIHKFFQRFPF